MEKLEKEAPNAFEWLKECCEDCTWARTFFDEKCKCEHVTNNFSESFNKWILELRDKPVTQFIIKLHLMIMTLMYEKSATVLKWDQDGSVPRVLNVIEEHKNKINKYRIRVAEWNTVHVENPMIDTSWTVRLDLQTCTCRVWEMTGIPCVHAVAVLMPRRVQWVDPCHSVASYKETYAIPILPITSKDDWEEPFHQVLSPEGHRTPGRPKKNRQLGDGELEEIQSKKRKCKKGGEKGHYARSCGGKKKQRKAKIKEGKEKTSTPVDSSRTRKGKKESPSRGIVIESQADNLSKSQEGQKGKGSQGKGKGMQGKPPVQPPTIHIEGSPAKNTMATIKTSCSIMIDTSPAKNTRAATKTSCSIMVNTSPAKNTRSAKARTPHQSQVTTANQVTTATQPSVGLHESVAHFNDGFTTLLDNFQKQFGKKRKNMLYSSTQ